MRRASRVLTKYDHAGNKKRCDGIGGNEPWGVSPAPEHHQSPSPTATTPLDQMSVEKCSASACSAWLSYFAAIVPSARERQKSTAMEKNKVRNAADAGLDLHMVKEQTLDRLVNNHHTSYKQ